MCIAKFSTTFEKMKLMKHTFSITLEIEVFVVKSSHQNKENHYRTKLILKLPPFPFTCSLVSDRMGSCISRTDLTNFSYELHISELKTQLRSNVIPIGKVRSGIYYHRALLFKV